VGVEKFSKIYITLDYIVVVNLLHTPNEWSRTYRSDPSWHKTVILTAAYPLQQSVILEYCSQLLECYYYGVVAKLLQDMHGTIINAETD